MKRRTLAPPFLALLVALTAAALVFASSCMGSTTEEPPPHGNWPMYQLNAQHNAVIEDPGLHADWVARLGDKINGGLAIVDGVVYADSFDHKVYAIDERTGAIRWSSATGNIVMSTPVVRDGIVIIGSGHNGFLKPDDYISQIWGRPEGDDVFGFSTADGHVVWKVHTIGQDMPSPAIDGDSVIFANGDAHAYALDLHDGHQKWLTPLPGPSTMASATIADGMVFVSTCHNAPYFCETRAMDVRDGKTVWTNPEGGSDCSPTVADGLVFVNGNVDDTVHYHTGGVDVVAAIDERTGRTAWKWSSDPGPYTFPASNERQIAGTYANGVYFQPIGQDSRVVAFDARSGKVRWNLRTWANVKMSPVVRGGRVYFGDTAGILYNVDERDGKVMHTSSYLQPFSTSPPIIVGDTMFIADGDLVVATSVDGI